MIAHLLGNLQVFLGKSVMNHYAETLHGNLGLLWAVRIILIVSVALHIWSSIDLAVLKQKARPTGYVKKRNVESSYASRTMFWSGVVTAAFVVYHLLHLTTGTVHPNFVELNAYDNVVNGFRVVPAAIAYIVAMFLIAMHLSHGVWSMFQSLGLNHPRYMPLAKKFAVIVSWVLFAGFVSIPIAVITGILQ